MEMKNQKLGERGSATLMAVATVVMLGILGTAVVETSSSGYTSNANEINGNQATYVGQAGLEDAKFKLDNGLDPTVVDKPFGPGFYSISTDYNTGEVTVTSRVGNARRTQSLTSNFSYNCVAFDTSEAVISGNELLHVKLVKTCNTAAVLDEMTVDWDWAECANSSDDDDSNDDSSNDDSSNDDSSNDSNSSSECNNGEGNGGEGCDSSENGNDDEDTDDASDDDSNDDSSNDDDSNDNSACAVDHGGAQISYIYLEDTSFYNPTQQEGTPDATGAEPGETIDGVDYALTSDGEYEYTGASHSITFSATPAETGTYTLTATFSDGSMISTTFTATATNQSEDDSSDDSSADDSSDDSSDDSGSNCNNGEGNGSEGCSSSENGNNDEDDAAPSDNSNSSSSSSSSSSGGSDDSSDDNNSSSSSSSGNSNSSSSSSSSSSSGGSDDSSDDDSNDNASDNGNSTRKGVWRTAE